MIETGSLVKEGVPRMQAEKPRNGRLSRLQWYLLFLKFDIWHTQKVCIGQFQTYFRKSIFHKYEFLADPPLAVSSNYLTKLFNTFGSR